MIKALFFADSHLGFDFPVRPRISRNRRGDDFFQNYQEILDIAKAEQVNVLIHGGDVFFRSKVPLPVIQKTYEPLLPLLESGMQMLFVPGNHEFYSKGRINKIREEMLEAEKECNKVHLLWNKKKEINGQTFIGTPLWSNFKNGDPYVMLACDKGITDFHTTMLTDRDFWSPLEMAKDWRIAYDFLSDNIVLGNEIVITHWAPSMQSSHPKYAGELINPYWCNEMDNFINTFQPKVWIHGHTHNSWDYTIGETRILCNPRGYDPHEPNPDFDINKYFEV